MMWISVEKKSVLPLSKWMLGRIPARHTGARKFNWRLDASVQLPLRRQIRLES
jgi:hypothetical protein